MNFLKPKKTKAIYDNYYIDKTAEIRKNNEKIDFNNLTYFFKGNSAPINFIGFKGPLHIFKSIYSGSIALQNVEKEQKSLKAKLNEISMGNPRNRSREQDNVVNNVTNHYKSRQNVVQMFHDYPREKSRRIYESKQGGTGLKMLTPNEMFKRLTIALAQISVGNNSEGLLNEIRQKLLKKYTTT